MPSDVLYFPTIHIRNVGWLKSALLLWDHVYRIVPDGVTPKDDDEVRECVDSGRLRNIKLEKAELFEVSQGYRVFLDSLEELPDGLDDAQPRRIHRGKIDERLYPHLLEIMKDMDQSGYLQFGYGPARGYMFHLSQVAAARRNLARATDDPDAWTVAPFFSEEGNFHVGIPRKAVDRFYGTLIIENLLPGDIGHATMGEILKLADTRRDERAELRSHVDAIGDRLARIESADHADAILADTLMGLSRTRDEYRASLGFGNKLDRYCAVGVGLPTIASIVCSALSLPVMREQMVGLGVFLGALAGYATYQHLQRDHANSVGAYLLDMEKLASAEDRIHISQDAFDEFLND